MTAVLTMAAKDTEVTPTILTWNAVNPWSMDVFGPEWRAVRDVATQTDPPDPPGPITRRVREKDMMMCDRVRRHGKCTRQRCKFRPCVSQRRQRPVEPNPPLEREPPQRASSPTSVITDLTSFTSGADIFTHTI
jgi:hypothetical protein